jgi:5'-nucleotidase
MDIRPLETSTPAYQPAPSQPVYQPAAQPVSYDAPAAATPVVSTTPAPVAGSKHVVKHGETMYSIARQSYGDGKQWTKIASANPGVSPSGLKVGQTLIIP